MVKKFSRKKYLVGQKIWSLGRYLVTWYVQPLNSGRTDSMTHIFCSIFRHNATQYKKYKKINQEHLLK